MKRFVVVGVAAVAGVLALRYMSRAPRGGLRSALSHRMFQRMEHFMASLPDNSPPKLVMSVLPRLREQNDEIIAMLREQNEILRGLPHKPG